MDAPQSPREKIASTNAYNQTARRWLYVGVFSILTAMLGLWGYNTFAQLSFIDWSGTAEAKLISQTRSEFNNLSKDSDLLNGKIKERLEQVKKEATELSATTTVSATITTSTTSTVER